MQKHPPELAKYTFANLLAWQPVYDYTWCLLHEEVLLISRLIDGERHLLQPIGQLSPKSIEFLLLAMAELAYPLKIIAVSDPFLLEASTFCSHFSAKLDRSSANYLYFTSDLASLSGPAYEKKRNLIAQSEELYTWHSHPLTEMCRPHCPAILADIGPKPDAFDETHLQNELVALQYTLEHFDALALKGVVIDIGGKPAAFSIYEPLHPQSCVVHFEKAERQYKGLYQIINRETAKAIEKTGFKFINREEDLGLPGLRQAKTSYSPAAMLSSYTLEFSQA